MEIRRILIVPAFVICGIVAAQTLLSEQAWAGEATPQDVISEMRKLVEEIENEKTAPMQKAIAEGKVATRKTKLAAMSAPAIDEIIKTVRGEKSAALRMHLLIALSMVKNRALLSAIHVTDLVRIAGDKSFPVRYWALKNLATARNAQGVLDRRAVPVLAQSLQSEDMFIVRLAIEAFAATKTKSAAEKIRPLLKHKLALIRIDAVTALKEIGGAADVRFIAPLLHAPDPIVRAAAVDAVERLTDKKFGITPDDDEEAIKKKIDDWIKANPLPK